MPARLRPAAAATKRRDRRVSERIQSIADIDTLQEDNFDVDSGRHFDHRLILLGALDQIFRDHVARLGHALAKASLQNLTGRELFALSRSEEHTSELQSLMRISYAVFCLKKKKKTNT